MAQAEFTYVPFQYAHRDQHWKNGPEQWSHVAPPRSAFCLARHVVIARCQLHTSLINVAREEAMELQPWNFRKSSADRNQAFWHLTGILDLIAQRHRRRQRRFIPELLEDNL